MIPHLPPLLLLALGLSRPVTFTFHADRTVKSVAVAGDFNGWDKHGAALASAGAGSPWSGTVDVPEGRHLYKFVLDGETFVADPRARERVPDGFGGFNSVVVVGPADARPARRGDGVIARAFLCHREGALDRARLPDGRVALRVRTRANDVERVRLVTPRGMVDAALVATDGDQDLYEAVVAAPPPHYRFRIEDGGGTATLGPFACQAVPPATAPGWVRDAVFYQIFPDRFRNGETSNDPPGTGAWGAAPTFTSWSGGDLDGVRQGLDYIASVGATALYLNPIFASESNHGYNTADYEHVAARFGGDAAFGRLMRDLKSRGMRVILDGVFNHTGTAFFAFADLVKRGAASRFAAWYRVTSWPIDLNAKKPDYEAWWGFGTLPRLMVDANPAVRAYLLDVVRRWTRAGIDGWRLDVPNEIGHPFWRAFRAVVRAIDPEAYIVGEIWEDGSSWLTGDTFDAVMNYRFRRALVEFLATGQADAPETARRLDRIRIDDPPGATLAQFNLIGSHDTERFLTLAHRERWRLDAAFTALAAFPGVPSIYYGDEVGLEGGKDPDNRRCFPWDRTGPANPVLAHTRRVFRVRREQGWGRYGEATCFALGPDVLGFRRPGPHGEELVVLVNRGAPVRLPPGVLASTLSWRAVEGTRDAIARGATVLSGTNR